MSKWKWLAGLMEEKNISQAELAKKINWPSPRISELLADKRDIPANKIRPLASVFNINTDELLDYNSGYRKQIPSISRSFNPKNVTIEILDATACCGNGIECFEENVVGCWNMPYDDFRTITTTSKAENVKLLRVKGDSMSPTIKDGDWVMADISLKQADSDGIYLLRMSTGLAIKRLQGSVKNDILIISDNPKYPTVTADSGEVTILGKVIYTLNAEKVG